MVNGAKQRACAFEASIWRVAKHTGAKVQRCCAAALTSTLEQPVAGHVQVKLHAWFAGLDWANLARTKAAFIPELDSPTDTAYFAPKPARIPERLCCSENVGTGLFWCMLHRSCLRRSFAANLHISTFAWQSRQVQANDACSSQAPRDEPMTL